MKNIVSKLLFTAVFALCSSPTLWAESWRIHNDLSKGAHFASLNEAMDTIAVSDGDTLYLDPGCLLTAEQTITKAVTVIGTGWGFTNKPYAPASLSGKLLIKNAAKVMGVGIANDVTLYSSNVTLEGCNAHEVGVSGDNIQNVDIIGCVIWNEIMGNATASHWNIYNSYIINQDTYGTTTIYNVHQSMIVNCVIVSRVDKKYCISTNNSTIKNNIIVNTRGSYVDYIVSGSNNVIYNNCLSAKNTSAYAAANVCEGTASLTHFVTGVGDGTLVEGSPAKGAGEGGIDCGIYAEGSLYPFIRYGLPEHVPHFTEVVIPTQPTDGKVKVTLKIENQNR